VVLGSTRKERSEGTEEKESGNEGGRERKETCLFEVSTSLALFVLLGCDDADGGAPCPRREGRKEGGEEEMHVPVT